MLPLQKRISALVGLGNLLKKKSAKFNEIILQTYFHNNWFIEENIRFAIQNIVEKFLNKEKLELWTSKYFSNPKPKIRNPKSIGMVMAGNIPLVGFHDFLCVLVSGNIAQVKLSSKDKFLLSLIAEKLVGIDASFKNKIHFVEILKNFDAVIATGSNNTSVHFEYYFGKYPHIIRKHRNSVAILNGDETRSDFEKLGKDIFQYFGMGCRNVSKLYAPQKYSFNDFFNAIDSFKNVIDHNKYKNNYDYNCTLLLMNKTPFLSNDFLMLAEKETISSPIATLHYEFYKNEKELLSKLKLQKENIQCVLRKNDFGNSQLPELWDYADNIDTMKFLKDLQG